MAVFVCGVRFVAILNSGEFYVELFLVIAAASFLAPRSLFLVTVVAESAIAHSSSLNAGDVLFLHYDIAAFYIILPEATAEATTETTAAAERITT